MKYTVTATVTISLFKEIEAASPDEAEEKAYLLGVPHLCYSCTREQKDTWRVSELDGTPEDIRIEE